MKQKTDYTFRRLFCFICLILSNQSYTQTATAMTFEQYIEDHSSSQMRAYLTGYADAIHNNAYFFGGCPKRFQYRPYSEYMQHIDIYIAQRTKDDGTNRELFLQKS